MQGESRWLKVTAAHEVLHAFTTGSGFSLQVLARKENYTVASFAFLLRCSGLSVAIPFALLSIEEPIYKRASLPLKSVYLHMTKRLVLCLILGCCALLGHAQLAPEGTRWRTTFFDVFTVGHHSYVASDTLLDGVTYSKIKDNYGSIPKFYTDSNGVIFYYHLARKNVFFNFNYAKGDTVYVDLMNHCNDSITQQFPVLITDVYFSKYYYPTLDSVITYLISPADSLPCNMANLHIRPLALSQRTLFNLTSSRNTSLFHYSLFSPTGEYGENLDCFDSPGDTICQVDRRSGLESLNSNFQHLILTFDKNSRELLPLIDARPAEVKGISIYNYSGQLCFSERKRPYKIPELADGYYFALVELTDGSIIHRKIKFD